MTNMDELNEENYRDFLQRHHVAIVSVINLEHQFLLSHLRSKFILNDEDCQIILFAGQTRQARVSKFLDTLATKGVEACKTFIVALEFEYPLLYEKLTGKKAGNKIPVSSMLTGMSLLGDDVCHHSKELGDLERDLMAKRVERLARELHDTSYGYQRAIEEKRECENELLKTSTELQAKNVYIQTLEEQLHAREKHSANGENGQDRVLQLINLHKLHQENIQKDKIIIALQSQLLCSNEELERAHSDCTELQQRNDSLTKHTRELQSNIDSEKRNSRQLNETVKSQNDIFTETAKVRRELWDAKYKLSLAVEEKDNLMKEFEEFRKWTELLNSRFDLIRFEKEEVVGVRDELSQSYLGLCDTVCFLETKVHDLELRSAFCEQMNKRLKDEVDLRTQEKQMILKKLDTVIEERESAFVDRDKLIKEIRGIQVSRELEMKEHQALYEKLNEELNKTKELLNVSEQKCVDLHLEISEAKSRIENQFRKSMPLKEGSHTSRSMSAPGNPDSTGDCVVPFTDPICHEFTERLSRRRAEEIINSIRRKIYPEVDPSRKGMSLPTNRGKAKVERDINTLPNMSKLLQMHIGYNNEIDLFSFLLHPQFETKYDKGRAVRRQGNSPTRTDQDYNDKRDSEKDPGPCCASPKGGSTSELLPQSPKSSQEANQTPRANLTRRWRSAENCPPSPPEDIHFFNGRHRCRSYQVDSEDGRRRNNLCKQNALEKENL